jgi:hypothetical protein
MVRTRSIKKGNLSYYPIYPNSTWGGRYKTIFEGSFGAEIIHLSDLLDVLEECNHVHDVHIDWEKGLMLTVRHDCQLLIYPDGRFEGVQACGKLPAIQQSMEMVFRQIQCVLK